MRVILFLLSIASFLFGAGILAVAQSAIHEIEAFMLFLISAVLLVGATITESVHVSRVNIETTMRQLFSKQPNVHWPPSHHGATQEVASEQVTPFAAQIVADPEGLILAGKRHEEGENADTLMAKAKVFVQSGDREKAVLVLQEVVRRFPGSAAAEKANRALQKK